MEFHDGVKFFPHRIQLRAYEISDFWAKCLIIDLHFDFPALKIELSQKNRYMYACTYDLRLLILIKLEKKMYHFCKRVFYSLRNSRSRLNGSYQILLWQFVIWVRALWSEAWSRDCWYDPRCLIPNIDANNLMVNLTVECKQFFHEQGWYKRIGSFLKF